MVIFGCVINHHQTQPMKSSFIAFLFSFSIFSIGCNNNKNHQPTNADNSSSDRKVDSIPPPVSTVKLVRKADIKDIKVGMVVTVLLNFDRYEEGDYAHTIFEEPNSADVEWDFGHPEENKFGDIPIVLKDDKSGWGYKTNPAYVNKRFIVTAEYKDLDGNDVDGKPMKYQDWRVTAIKPE
jgi:hypothetical protein